MIYILVIAITILLIYFLKSEAMVNSYAITHEPSDFQPRFSMEASDTRRNIYPVYGYIDKYQVIKPVRM